MNERDSSYFSHPKNLFERTSSTWVRYSEYEWKKAKDGMLYLVFAPGATPSIYDPLKETVKRGVESMCNIQNDRIVTALAMTMSNRPTAVNMSFQREYAERYDWLKKQFTDWAFNATTSFLYYHDYDVLEDDAKRLMQQSMAAHCFSVLITIGTWSA